MTASSAASRRTARSASKSGRRSGSIACVTQLATRGGTGSHRHASLSSFCAPGPRTALAAPIGFWRLTRYADVNRLLHEVPAGTRTTDGVLPGVDESLSGQRQFMLQQDPPTHTRLRRLVSRAFTPRAIAALRGNVQRIVDECLDRVAPR